MKYFFPVSLMLALGAPLSVAAQTQPDTPTEIQQLKQELAAMRAAYEARMKALEERLLAAERTLPASSASPAPGAAEVMASAAPSAAGANAFNPAMSLILSGGYTRTSREPASYAISGFALPPGAAAGPGTRGFSLAESELGLAANIDPWLRGAANISLHPDNTLSVEEAFVETTALGNGLSLKAGRFYSGVGYLNSQHAHTWDFVDNPLAYQAFLGTQYGDDGVQVKWLAPLDQYLELGAELGRGRSFPGSDTSGNGAGMAALTAHTGGDVGDSHNWRAGLSLLNAKASDQGLTSMDSSGNLINSVFSGSTRVWVLDGVWKWAPHGNASRTSFKLQGEYLSSTRDGHLSYGVGGANLTNAYRSVQSGWYLQGIYQFAPSWRLGLRSERLNAGTSNFGSYSALLAGAGYRPAKNSLMLDFSPSEFSRLRLQFAQDRARDGEADNQVFIQYQMSLGAHGAHNY